MRKFISTIRHIIIPIAISIAGILFMYLISLFLQNGSIPMWMISKHKLLNFTFTMQLLVLPGSFIAMLLMYFYNRKNFKTFLRIKIKFGSGLSEHENNWKFLGPLLAVAFTFGTSLLISFNVTAQHGMINEAFYKLIPWVVLFSLTNAWSEEIFSRFVIVAGLYNKLKPNSICWISSILFGLPHFFGTPNGIFGVIMSGLLGWLLAKSVIETKGIGWALFIHFLQDLIIFSGGAMIIAGNP